MTTYIPEGYEACEGCGGHGEIVVGTYAPVYYAFGGGEPGGEILKTCEACKGEGCFIAEPDEDFDADSDEEPCDLMDGDAGHFLS